MALTDLTRISTSGIATGTSLSGAILHGDAHFRGTQIGVTSALFDSSDNALEFNDNVKLTFGNDGDLKLYHNGSHSYIDETGTGNLYIRNGTKNSIWCKTDGQVNLYHNDVKKFETTQTGAVVTGILTASKFSGSLVGNTSNASGISTFYDLRVSNNLTVEGTTTTLDTNLIGVDRVEVGANSNTVTGIAVTQSGTADIVRLYDGASQVVTVDDEGNVGVGINSPSTKLQVHGGLIKISGHAYARVTVNDGANEAFFGFENQGPLLIGNANADAQIRVQGTNDIFFQTGNTVKRLTIKGNTGYVGINSTSPAYPLDVLEPTNNSGLISITGTNASYDTGFLIRNANNPKWYLINDVNGSGGHSFEIRGDGWSNDRFLTLTQTGSLGIGTVSPTDPFHVYHASDNFVGRFESGDAGGGIVLKDPTHSTTLITNDGDFTINVDNGGDVTGESIRFEMSGSEKLRIDSSGNVRLMTSTQNSYPGFLANSNAVNFTLGSTAGAEPRIYLFGSSNGQTTAKDISIITGSDTGDVLIRASKTTISSTVNEEIFRIQTSHGNSGSVQGKALMGFDHFNVSDKPAILIGSEEEGNASHKGSFVIKLKDAAATDDDPITRFKITSAGKIGINNNSPQEQLQIAGNITFGNRMDGTSRYIGKGTNGSGGVIGDASANANSCWIGFVSGSNTGEEDQLRFGTHKSGSSGGEKMRIDGLGRISVGKHGIGTHNDASEYIKIQSNDTSAVLSIIGSNNTHSTLALGDEDDFNRARIRADHTHDLLGFWTADAERLRITDKGVLSSFLNTSGSGNNTGNAYYHRPVLEITHNSGTPATQIKITTNIPWTGDGTHAHSVRLAGFRYGGRDTVDIQIGWHVYNNEFFNRVATSSGSYAPTITLAVESGKVVIHLTNPGYWPKFYVESLYHPYGSKEQAEGWSWSDSAISGDSGLPVNTVPYKWDAGGLSFNDSHNNNGQGDLNINDGNLIVASGHGINFGNTANGSGATGISELLDDYEFGDFTPTIHTNTNINSTSGENSSHTGAGQYTKVGKMVTVTVDFNNLHGNARDHVLRYISGLPFTSRSNNKTTAVIGYQRGLRFVYGNDVFFNQAGRYHTLYGYIGGSTTNLSLNGSMSYSPYSGWPATHNSSSSQYMRITISYFTD